VPRDQLARIMRHRARTGQATVVGYSTKNDLANWGDCHGRSLRAAGLKPAATCCTNAYGLWAVYGRVGYIWADNLGLALGAISGGMTPRQVAPDRRFQADGIHGDASYALSILDELRASRHRPAPLFAKVGISGPKPWTNAMRDRD